MKAALLSCHWEFQMTYPGPDQFLWAIRSLSFASLYWMPAPNVWKIAI
uniref:Uncharacterized protein n=1 Tax=Candidatus Nitrotoga fabula TaxID=2182327 RepID=A0A2X0QUU2_9PROT|nr:protein of unknown function [Candidatus Nitrotoga fabula]